MNNFITALQALLPACRMFRPLSGDSPLCLSAQARVYVSLCRLLSVADLEAILGSRADYLRLCDNLFTLVAGKALHRDIDCANRFLLVETLYFLATETGTCYNEARMNRCHDLLITLMAEYETLPAVPEASWVEPLLCRCLENYFYPALDADDAWTGLLHTCFARWRDSLVVGKGWDDADGELAWQRIETLNRYSYLFLDDTYDAVVRQACACYARQVPLSGEAVPALSACHAALSQGHLLAGNDALEVRVAVALEQQLPLLSPVSADGCRCLAARVEHLCRSILHACREELLQCIA